MNTTGSFQLSKVYHTDKKRPQSPVKFPGFHIPPALFLFLMVLWGAGSMYLFATGIGELIQINHEMTEALKKGHTALHSDPTAPVQIHVGWRLITGTILLGLPIPFFRSIYSRRRVF